LPASARNPSTTVFPSIPGNALGTAQGHLKNIPGPSREAEDESVIPLFNRTAPRGEFERGTRVFWAAGEQLLQSSPRRGERDGDHSSAGEFLHTHTRLSGGNHARARLCRQFRSFRFSGRDCASSRGQEGRVAERLMYDGSTGHDEGEIDGGAGWRAANVLLFGAIRFHPELFREV